MSGLVTKTVLNTKTSKVEDTSSLVITQKCNILTAENFAARLKQADLVNKNIFDNKVISFNKQITSKTKYLKVQKELNNLTTKDYNFFLSRIYFISDDGFQNIRTKESY